MTAFLSAWSMPRDCEAWGHVTFVSIQHPFLEAHVHIQANTLVLCVAFTARTSSHTNFLLCIVLIRTDTHSLCRGRGKNSHAAPAGGQFGEQDEAEEEDREPNAAMTEFWATNLLTFLCC